MRCMKTCTQRTPASILPCYLYMRMRLVGHVLISQTQLEIERESKRKLESEMKKFNKIHGGFLELILVVASLIFISTPGGLAWSKEGHIMTCRIAQDLLEPEAEEAVKNLLPDHVGGDLSALCTWPDQIRHWHKYRWTSPLHYIDTPDGACNFDYTRDCRDSKGTEDMCVAGAVRNFTSQLMHYREGTSDRRYNLTEALLFLSHFMGDIHQPMHVGFTSDAGGNTIALRWFRRKSNLHHVWDRDIILTAMSKHYGKDMENFLEDIQKNLTTGIWSDDVLSWDDCDDLFSCPIKYAEESISLACKWAYKDVSIGDTLEDDYFTSRLPIISKRIAQGGVRLSMILNRVFTEESDAMSVDSEDD